MNTQTYPELDLLIGGILDARTVTDEQKASLLDELKAEGPTAAMLEKIDALFAAEIADAETDLSAYLAMLPDIEAALTEEERNALPALMENSGLFAEEMRAFATEESARVADMERTADDIMRSSSDSEDTDAAAAIRKSLGLE